MITEFSGENASAGAVSGSERGGWNGRRLWLAGAALAIAYGSLIPFDFDPAAITFSDVTRVGRLHWSYGGPGDLFTNVLLYLPFGWLAIHCLANGHLGILRACLWSVVLGSALSLSLEVLQTESYSRYASWSDVLLNTCGTALGAVLGAAFPSAWIFLRKRLAGRRVRNPYALLASLLAAAIFLFHLAPFDFVMTTESLQRSFLNANWNATPGHIAGLADPTLAAFVGKMATAGWFGVLAYLWAFACLWSSCTPTAGLTKAIAHTMALVWLIECMQLFTVSHVFELSDIFLRSLGAILGAWTAVFIVDHTGNLWKRRPSLVLPTTLLVALVVGQALAVLFESYRPHGFGAWAFDGLRIEWMPFLHMWHGSTCDAVMSALSILVCYGVLAVTLSLLAQRLRRATWAVGPIVVLLASTAELVHAGRTSHSADITRPLLAVVSAILATRGLGR
ncbi:MAG: VanZ family protein, partial [Planctomycetes bacterium]|nr:VanZ family protein [Planctomycetota bacterium]